MIDLKKFNTKFNTLNGSVLVSRQIYYRQGLVVCLGNREGHDDAGAAFGAVLVDDRAAQVVAAGAVDEADAGVGGFAPVEVGGEAGAVVADLEAGGLSLHGQSDFYGVASVLDGVAHQFGDQKQTVGS